MEVPAEIGGLKMELIGVEEVMAITLLGRAKVTRLLNDKTCPIVPRTKGEPYLIDRKAFMDWFEARCYMKKK